MKKILSAKILLAACGGLLMTSFLSIPLKAQDDSEQKDMPHLERQEMMAQRHAELQENNPEAAARMEQNRQRRQEYRQNNPEEVSARREERRERLHNGGGSANQARKGAGRSGPNSGFRPGPPADADVNN